MARQTQPHQTDEAWQDVEAALVDAEPLQQVVLRNTRVGLLLMVGRFAEAEEDATATMALAAEHAPEYVGNLHTNLALLAEQAGDERGAATHRLLAENPGRLPVGLRWHRCVELNARGVVLAADGDRVGAVAAYEAAYRETDGVDDVEAAACRAAVAGNLPMSSRTTTRWCAGAPRPSPRHGRSWRWWATATAVPWPWRPRWWPARWPTTPGRALPEALADLDDAVEVLPQVDHQPVEATVRAARARVLAGLGRYAEAAHEARSALELAYAAEPALAAGA